LISGKILQEKITIANTYTLNISYDSCRIYILWIVHKTFSKIDIFQDKVSLNKYKTIEIIFYIVSEHNSIKLESKSEKITENIQTDGGWTIHRWIMSRYKKLHRIKCKWKHNLSESLGHSKDSGKRNGHISKNTYIKKKISKK
jgi:hypothetical protein